MAKSDLSSTKGTQTKPNATGKSVGQETTRS